MPEAQGPAAPTLQSGDILCVPEVAAYTALEFSGSELVDFTGVSGLRVRYWEGHLSF